MGLFSREPAEKKAFWKAFDSALSKPGDKTFPALEEACKAWPVGWQGYFLMAICYDLGVGVPFDPVKAADYHYETQETARKTNNQWVPFFYEYYNESAINFKCKEDYFPRTLNVRKVGVAMMLSVYVRDDGVLTDHGKKNDLSFWKTIFNKIDIGSLFKTSDEQWQVMNHKEPFTQWIYDMESYQGNADEKMMIDYTNRLLKQTDKLFKKKNDEVDLKFVDTWLFTFGVSCFFGGKPYKCDGEGWYTNPRINAWRYLWHASYYGCAPAIHLIGTYWDDETFHNEIVFAATTVVRNLTTEKEALRELYLLLEKSALKEDKCAEGILADLAE